MKRKSLSFLSALTIFLCLWPGYSGSALGDSDPNDQIDWLIKMQNLHATGLVESYENVNDTNAWLFDQALAIVAFTAADEEERAKDVLNVMESLQLDEPNGAWFECYNAPDASYAGCWKYVTGPIAWMVIAVNFYEDKTADVNYAPVARKALGWIDTMMHIDDQNDGRYGSLKYSNADPQIISTEHNINAYSAYYWRGILDSNASYIEKANLVLDYLRSEMWAPSPNSNCCKDINVFCRGYNDCEVTTDCQSWGVLSLGPFGPDHEWFNRSLCWLLDPNDSTRTVQDYNESITDVNGFRGSPGDNNYIEVDFTEHVAAAFYSIGDDFNGDRFHNQMKRIVDTNGGLVHSFCQDDPNNIRWPENHRYYYVASVAWHYFNEVKINPFVLPSSERWARAANIDKKSFVNFLDYAILASEWLESDPGLAGDINEDESVDMFDLSIFVDHWLCGCE